MAFPSEVQRSIIARGAFKRGAVARLGLTYAV